MLDKLFFRLQSRSKQSYKYRGKYKAKYKWLIASFMCFALLAKAPDCKAQYFGLGNGLGYSGFGSSLLYPFSYLFYSGYGNSYASPLYGAAALGSGFFNNALYSSFRNIPYNSYSPYNNYYSASNYASTATPNTNPFNYNPNQNQTPVWNYSANNTFSSPQQSLSPQLNSPLQQNSPSQQSNDPNDIFNSGSTLTATDPNANKTRAPLTAPTAAPDQHTLGQSPNTMMPYPYPSGPQRMALEGFFQTVNLRYRGNLFHALNQMDMRAWAASIGLIYPGEQIGRTISPARKNEISSVIKDPSLNAQKKVEIIHLLLQ